MARLTNSRSHRDFTNMADTLARVETKIEGLEELYKALEEFPKGLQGNALGQAARDAAKPVLNTARRNAPIGTRKHYINLKGRRIELEPGHLARNIESKSKTSRNKEAAFVAVGPRDTAFYGSQFVDPGHRILYGWGAKTQGSNAREGYISPTLWLTNALVSNENVVIERMSKKLGKLIDKWQEPSRRPKKYR